MLGDYDVVSCTDDPFEVNTAQYQGREMRALDKHRVGVQNGADTERRQYGECHQDGQERYVTGRRGVDIDLTAPSE